MKTDGDHRKHGIPQQDFLTKVPLPQGVSVYEPALWEKRLCSWLQIKKQGALEQVKK